MHSNNFDDHCSSNTLKILYNAIKLSIKQVCDELKIECNDKHIHKLLGCDDEESFSKKWYGEFNVKRINVAQHILKQLELGNYAVGYTNASLYALINENFNSIYPKQVKLYEGLLNGVNKLTNKLDELSSSSNFNSSFSIISNNTLGNIQSIRHLFCVKGEQLIPDNNFYGISPDKGITIKDAKPNFSYLSLAAKHILNIDLTDTEQQKKLTFLYSGDRPTDLETAVNASKNKIDSMAILHDVDNSSTGNMKALLEQSEHIPIIILQGDRKETVHNLSEVEISVAENIYKSSNQIVS